MHIVDFINLNQILKKHEDQITKQSSLTAVISIDKLAENLGHQLFKVISVLQDLRSAE